MSYKDKSLSPIQRAKDLLSKMNVEEKAAQVVQLAFTENTVNWAKKGIGSVINAYDKDVLELQRIAVNETRLGIPILFSIDCIHGHALNNAATVFPNQLAMAQSFDREALKRCAEISAKETLCDGIRYILSPVLDIARDTRWGRISETFGEDPYLAGELGAAMVEGYQSEPVICCPKHFVAHSESKGGRDSYEVSITDRKVKQFFAPAFTKAVKAGCGSVMSGQQVHNGKPMCINDRLINGFLKGDDKFEGFVVTDNQGSRAPFEYGVAKTAEEGFYQALMCGNDMMMYCSKDTEFADIAVKLASEHPEFAKRLDDAVLRILIQKFKMGLFENPYLIYNADEIMCCEEHYKDALEITRKSITMLENKNNILPLDTSKVKTIAVIGPAADNRYSQYGDWTYLNMPFSKNDHTDLTGRCKTYYEAIKEKAQEYGIDVLYSDGCDIKINDKSNIPAAVEVAQKSDIVVLCLGDDNRQNGEHRDRAHLELSGKQNELFDAILDTNKPIIVILSNGKPLIINKVAKCADAILECFNGGIAGGVAAAEIIFGEVSPSGRLPISFPYSEGQIPVYYNQMYGWHADGYLDEEHTPLYSFGYGLTYTEFEYNNLTCETLKDGISVKLSVKNIGKRAGVAVPQVYVRFITASYMQPIKNLKGFDRVPLAPNEEKECEFIIPFDELKIVGDDLVPRLEKGEIEIMAGSSSRDCDLIKTIINSLSER